MPAAAQPSARAPRCLLPRDAVTGNGTSRVGQSYRVLSGKGRCVDALLSPVGDPRGSERKLSGVLGGHDHSKGSFLTQNIVAQPQLMIRQTDTPLSPASVDLTRCGWKTTGKKILPWYSTYADFSLLSLFPRQPSVATSYTAFTLYSRVRVTER